MDYRHPLLKLLRRHASAIGARIARATARDLKLYRDNLPSGPDSGLKNVWEEICVQVQGERSFFWDEYRHIAMTHITHRVDALPDIKRRMFWAGSPDGMMWIDEHEEAKYAPPVPGDDVPTGDTDDVANWLFDDYLVPLADDYRNRRIERFLERESDFD